MARFRLTSRDLRVERGRHEGMGWFACGSKRCAALGMRKLPVDDEAHLLFPYLSELAGFAQLPFPSLQDLMC
jgi:hypothetical protein